MCALDTSVPESDATSLPTLPTDTHPCSPATLNHSRAKSCASERPFGSPDLKSSKATSDPMTSPAFAAEWIACLSASRARILAELAPVLALTERAAASPSTACASLAFYDASTHSLRTSQTSLTEDSTAFSASLPRWGMMRAGQLYPLPQPALPTAGTACGSWPTPCKSDQKGSARGGQRRGQLSEAVLMFRCWPTPLKTDSAGSRRLGYGGGRMNIGTTLTDACAIHLGEKIGMGGSEQRTMVLPNPEFEEWLMRLPGGWSNIEWRQSEMGKTCLPAQLRGLSLEGQ